MSDKEQDFSFYDLFVPLTTRKAITFIVVIGLIVFFNTLFNGFVWDDRPYIIDNPDVHSIHILSLFQSNSFNHEGQYRPLTALYFAIQYTFFKDASFFYHILQLGIHITNVIVIFLILKHFFKTKLSFILTLFLLIHPIQVESVSYIAASDNTLFFLFGSVALWLSLKNTISWKRLIAILSLLVLSFLTKETGILFLFIILLNRILFHRKKGSGTFLSGGVIAVAVYLVIRLGIGRVNITQTHPTFLSITTLPLIQRLLHIPGIILYYLTTFFYPAQLAVDQQWVISTISLQNFYLPLLIDLIFFVMLGWLGLYVYKVNKKSFKVYSFFLLWFLGGLGMHLQIIPLDMTVADRWFYFPIVGLLGLAGCSISCVSISLKKFTVLGYIALLLAFSLLSIRTIVRNTNWVDETTLYNHDLQVQDNYEIENNLGAVLVSEQGFREALPHLLKSTEYFSFDSNLYNLGTAYSHLGDNQKAQVYYEKAITTKNISLAHDQDIVYASGELARIAILQNRPEVALQFVKKAMDVSSTNGNLWLYLAISEYKLHHQVEALAAAEKAKSLTPNTQTISIYNLILNKQVINLQNG